MKPGQQGLMEPSGYVRAREVHGLHLSIDNDSSSYSTDRLWANLLSALHLIAVHAPVWIDRMRKCDVTIHVERTPGTRAKLLGGKQTVLDSYFVFAFLPAQIASSIVHESVHARLRAWGIPHSLDTIAHEERLCRRGELRFGGTLLALGVEGAAAVVVRAEKSLTLADEEVAPTVDWRRLETLALSSRRESSGLRAWLQRWPRR